MTIVIVVSAQMTTYMTYGFILARSQFPLFLMSLLPLPIPLPLPLPIIPRIDRVNKNGQKNR